MKKIIFLILALVLIGIFLPIIPHKKYAPVVCVKAPCNQYFTEWSSLFSLLK